MNSFIVYLSILWYSFVDVNCTLVLLKTSSVQFLNLVALPSPVTCIWVFWKWIWPARNLMLQHSCQIWVAISGDLILYLSLSKYSQVFQICTSQNVCSHQVSLLCLLTVHSYSELSSDICNDVKEQWTLYPDLQTDSSYFKGEDNFLILKMTIWYQAEPLFRCKF